MKRLPPRPPTQAEFQERAAARSAFDVAARMQPWNREHMSITSRRCRAPGMTPFQHFALLRAIYGKDDPRAAKTVEELR